jgi:hypothetical protein
MTTTYSKLLLTHAKEYRELRLEHAIKKQDPNTFAIGAFAEDNLISNSLGSL